MLDPIIADMDRRRVAEGYPEPFSAATGGEARAHGWAIRNAFYPSPDIPVAGSEPRLVPGPGGTIPVRVIRPLKPSGATVLYLHGGGWIIGDLESHHAHACRLADVSGAVVVNVDYRLAPEHPFPAAPLDAIAALEWVAAHIGELGGDPARLAVAGDSAGGNLAAVAALHARDAGLPLRAQLLCYPLTDFRRRTGKPTPVEPKYLGPDYVKTAADWRASPITADLRGVAPVILGTGRHDYLHADNLAFAAALCTAGVPLDLRIYDSLNHGFASFTGVVPAALNATVELYERLSLQMR